MVLWRKAFVRFYARLNNDGQDQPGRVLPPDPRRPAVQNPRRRHRWPTRKETVTTAIFVAILMTILALFFLGVDSLFGAVVRWLLTLA